MNKKGNRKEIGNIYSEGRKNEKYLWEMFQQKHLGKVTS